MTKDQLSAYNDMLIALQPEKTPEEIREQHMFIHWFKEGMTVNEILERASAAIAREREFQAEYGPDSECAPSLGFTESSCQLALLALLSRRWLVFDGDQKLVYGPGYQAYREKFYRGLGAIFERE